MIGQLIMAAVLMILLSAVVLFWPRRRVTDSLQSPAQLFEQRLQLLALARDSGELADEDFTAAAQELKSQFLLQQQQAVSQDTQGKRLPLALLLLLALLVGAIYSQNGHYRQIADWQQAQQKLQQYGERALLNQGEPLSVQELEWFALGLRTRLANEGDDAVAWMLLGRIRLSQGAAEQAVAAFEKALQLSPERIPLLLSYAQALILLGDEDSLARAGRAVARILTAEPQNSDALSLMALIAYENGDLAQATSAWQMLLQQLTTEDPRYAAVQQRLTELGVDVQPTGRQIRVSLYVDPSLHQTNPDASLFVFAKAVDGAALPLAVQRIPLPTGNYELLLTEQMAMQPGWSLASVDQVVVIARMSLSGTVELRPGDVQTQSDTLAFSEPSVAVSLTLEP